MKSDTATPKPVIVVISYGTLDPAGEKEQGKIDRIIRSVSLTMKCGGFIRQTTFFRH